MLEAEGPGFPPALTADQQGGLSSFPGGLPKTCHISKSNFIHKTFLVFAPEAVGISLLQMLVDRMKEHDMTSRLEVPFLE